LSFRATESAPPQSGEKYLKSYQFGKKKKAKRSLLAYSRSLIEKSIASTFDDGNGSYGNMFDVIALKRVVIFGLEIHTDAESSQEYEVYTKTGGFSACQYNLTCWGAPISSGSVTPKGRWEPTPLPVFSEAVIIEGTERQAFYVTLKFPYLRYSSGTNTNEVFVENQDLQILAGAGIGHYPINPRLANFNNRIWNGVILYDAADDPSSSPTLTPSLSPTPSPSLEPSFNPSSSPTSSPTSAPSSIPSVKHSPSPSLEPSFNPSSSPTMFGMVDGSIFTTTDGDRGGFGSMFDIKVLSNLSVTGMEFLTASNDEISFEVWTKPDSHVGNETSSENWRLISKGSVPGKGPYTFTAIPKNMWLFPARLLANATQAFYVTLKEQKLLYSLGLERGAAHTSNDDIVVTEGTGFADVGFSNNFFSPRVWNGGLQYLSLPLILSNNAESVTQLSSKAQIYLTGLSFKMDLNSTATFESAATKILNDKLLRAVPPIHVLGVNVTGQEIIYSRSRALMDHLLHYSESVQSSVVIDTIVTGEYQPPPDVNFDVVVEESINEESEIMIKKLKEDVFFQQLSGINAIAEAEVVKDTSLQDSSLQNVGRCDNFFCVGGKQVLVGSAATLIVFLVICATCCLGRRKDLDAQAIQMQRSNQHHFRGDISSSHSRIIPGDRSIYSSRSDKGDLNHSGIQNARAPQSYRSHNSSGSRHSTAPSRHTIR